MREQIRSLVDRRLVTGAQAKRKGATRARNPQTAIMAWSLMAVPSVTYGDGSCGRP